MIGEGYINRLSYYRFNKLYDQIWIKQTMTFHAAHAVIYNEKKMYRKTLSNDYTWLRNLSR